MAFLDGKEPIKPTPYDAHEQIVRKSHSFSPEQGYQPAPEKAPEKESE
ncbi:MAG: hypothetical protein ACLPLR_09610 [Terriglobales bacterium]